MIIVYFVAKEELFFSKFNFFIFLQKKNGFELILTYVNDKICVEMVFVIGKFVKEDFVIEINSKYFISVMVDGVIDVGGIENEIVFCRFV